MSPVATEIEFAWVGHAPPMRSPQSTPEITPRARTLTYFPLYIDASGKVLPPPAGSKVDAFGVQVDPVSLANCAQQVHAATGKPILVTENGMMTDQDGDRIAHAGATLAALGAAMDGGVPLLGYIHWSLLDNYEWGSYKPKFGLVAVDRTTFKRTPKPSAWAIGGYAKRNWL